MIKDMHPNTDIVNSRTKPGVCEHYVEIPIVWTVMINVCTTYIICFTIMSTILAPVFFGTFDTCCQE